MPYLGSIFRLCTIELEPPDSSIISLGEEEALVLTVDISAHGESPRHHKSFLDLFVNDTPAGSINPQPPHYMGKFEIEMTDLNAGDTVRCQAKCNFHGVWESSVDV